ncbi:MAG: hypothetical protein OXC81_05540 [Betaproteobacteria bacterium]|nr:hypothetical protein [Betaproteobacteria bacterium]
MITVICDSSSLIDIDKTGLLVKALRLPYCYVITDMAAEELKELPQSQPQDIYQNGLQIVKLSADQLTEAGDIHCRRQSHHRGLHLACIRPECQQLYPAYCRQETEQ